MQTESSAGSGHPKHVLYDEVYDPITTAWFVELDRCQRLPELLAQASQFDLLKNLNELNSLFHTLVDECLNSLHPKTDRMIAIVRRLREHVIWEGQMTPGFDATDEQIRAALSNKIKRNISMGAMEAVICLEGATGYGKDKLGLNGKALEEVIRRSLPLCASLAALHDVQEQQRLRFLTGEVGYLKYPDVTFVDLILGGRYQISAEKYETVGSDDKLQLKFVGNRVPRAPHDSPIRRCPAQRLGLTDHRGGPVLNETLWSILVDIYRLSGRFA